MGRDVPLQQPAIKVNGAGTQTGTLLYPPTGVLLNFDCGPLRVSPLATDQLRLDHGEVAFGVLLPYERLWRASLEPIRAAVPNLVAPRGAAADTSKAATAGAGRHQATPLVFRHIDRGVIGSTRPAATNAAMSCSEIRT